MEFMGAAKSGFCCLGGHVREDVGSITKEGVELGAMDFFVSSLWLEMGVLVSIRNLPLEWKFEMLDKKSKVVWHMALICLFSCI